MGATRSRPQLGLSILRSDQANQPAHCVIKPALYMTVQGTKWAAFAEKRYEFEEGQALMVAVDIPSMGTVTVASPKKSYLGIAIELNSGIMQAVAERLR
jgi:hypothetical protein